MEQEVSVSLTMSMPKQMTREQILAFNPRASQSVLAANAMSASPAPSIANVPAPTPKPAGPKMNGTERDYGLILEANLRRGDIIEYAFEPFSLRYGANAFYKPDWVARTGGDVTIADLAQLCSLHVIDIVSQSGLLETYQKLVSGVYFRVIECKGPHIFPEAKPRWKAAKLRHPWAEWEMHQKKKGTWTRIL